MNAFKSFLDSDKEAINYVYLFQMVSRVTRQGSGLLWSDIEEVVEGVLEAKELK